jgi:hypothetical protein
VMLLPLVCRVRVAANNEDQSTIPYSDHGPFGVEVVVFLGGESDIIDD